MNYLVNYLPYPEPGEYPLWDLCVIQSQDIIYRREYGYETKYDDCGEGLELDFISFWGFEPCWERDELFGKFWTYYQDLQRYIKELNETRR
tara:strand:+ start:171 stop:443 length:273 start_codon:yes stop_codon:yes gene_type:complete